MVETVALMVALVGSPIGETRVTTPDCAVRIEQHADVGQRPFFRLRPDCPLSRASTVTAVATLRANAAQARAISVGFGRIVRYPWLSALLAREASSAPGWNATRGRPQQGHANAFVARLLKRSLEFRSLFGAWTLRSVSVEKVLVKSAAELDLPAGAPFSATARFPFDAQLWVQLERR
jgi:hypothetical protein